MVFFKLVHKAEFSDHTLNILPYTPSCDEPPQHGVKFHFCNFFSIEGGGDIF